MDRIIRTFPNYAIMARKLSAWLCGNKVLVLYVLILYRSLQIPECCLSCTPCLQHQNGSCSFSKPVKSVVGSHHPTDGNGRLINCKVSDTQSEIGGRKGSVSRKVKDLLHFAVLVRPMESVSQCNT